jgi:beta-lactamase class A
MEYTREQLYHRAIIGIVFLPNRQHFFISVFVTTSNENADTHEKIIADISKVTWDYFTGNTK